MTAALAVVGIASEAKADPKPVVSGDVPEHALGASFGFDPTWTLGIGYWHGWRHVLGEHDARFDLALDAPVVLIPTGQNWRLTAGLTPLFHVRNRFQIAVSFATGVSMAQNVLGRKLAWVFQTAFRPGLYVDRGHFAADLSYRVALNTRVWHSDVVQETFRDRYPPGSFAEKSETGPFDGWYAFRSQRLRVGVTGGVTAGIVGFFAGAGFQYTPQPPGILMNSALGTFPFYANVGMDFRWPKH